MEAAASTTAAKSFNDIFLILLLYFLLYPIVYSKSFVTIAEPTVDLPSSCESCVLFTRKQLANDRNDKISAVEKEINSCLLHVKLDIPYEMWVTPSVEIVTLKKNCETLLERYENDLEHWHNMQNKPLLEVKYLCKKQILKRTERGCEISFRIMMI
uniref:DUF3456 domain-containing protein n=1 Tax=Wuchereria bancrofti TaxID=6293 RepID=A0A1I8ETI9_WUCBA